MYLSNIPYPAETGGPSHIESIVDLQEGPTCGLEAVENVIQLFGLGSNDLVHTHLLQMAANRGVLWQDEEGYILDTSGYQPLLAAFGIATSWYSFDHRYLIRALRSNRVAIAVLDAHQLDPGTYPEPESWHAIVITSYVVDPVRRHIVAYVGADSNHPGRERVWSADAMELATRFPDHPSLLITDVPITWPSKADHYVRLAYGAVVPVRRVLRR